MGTLPIENPKAKEYKEYKVHIKEILCKTVEIRAKSLERAMEIARERYKNESYVLTADDYSSTEIQAESYDGSKYTGWEDL